MICSWVKRDIMASDSSASRMTTRRLMFTPSTNGVVVIVGLLADGSVMLADR
jgi:hypothetical protein